MDILNKEFLLFINCAAKNKLRYLLIGGYAVNYHGYNRHTADLDIWLAPTNENKTAFINTLVCMEYSDEETDYLKEEDFTKHFVGSIGGNDAMIDVLKEMKLLTHREKDLFDIARLEEIKNSLNPEK